LEKYRQFFLQAKLIGQRGPRQEIYKQVNVAFQSVLATGNTPEYRYVARLIARDNLHDYFALSS
jgi:hypothetical protein